MMNISSYPGDGQAQAITARLLKYTTLGELKAAIAGSVLGLDLVSPLALLNRIQEEDGGNGEAKEEDVKSFLSLFMSLWNDIAQKHQEENTPFLFTPIPADLKVSEYEQWNTWAWQRMNELDDFLLSLREAGSYNEEDVIEQFNPNFLPHVLDATASELEGHICPADGEATNNWAEVERLIIKIDRDMQALWPQFIRESKQLRVMNIEAQKAFTRYEQDFSLIPKIGRNDPCPCKSGKKFKKCCLQ
jgi:uncharacterized protein YecA (UPF0149 family)